MDSHAMTFDDYFISMQTPLDLQKLNPCKDLLEPGRSFKNDASSLKELSRSLQKYGFRPRSLEKLDSM